LIDVTLPLIDLHRHLDGSIRLETILELGKKHGIPLPASDIEGLRPHVQITDPRPGVMAFIEKFKYMIGVLADYDACRRVAYENVEDASLEGIDYIELRFSPLFMAEPHSLSPEGVVEAVLEGVNQGQNEFGIKVNIIGIISRTYGIGCLTMITTWASNADINQGTERTAKGSFNNARRFNSRLVRKTGKSLTIFPAALQFRECWIAIQSWYLN